MTLILPTPYPDETIYSVCARYADRMRFPAHYLVNELLFGRRHKKNSGGLFQGLTQVACWYPHLSADDLLEHHTILPFFAPFLSVERLATVRKWMLNADGKPLNLYTSTTSNLISPPAKLRYCSKCVAEHRRRWNETYWNRLHQLPGIHVCPKHHCCLNTSNVRIGVSNQYVSAESCLGESTETELNCFTEFDPLQAELAKNAIQLFGKQFWEDDLRRRYIAVLTNKGYATHSGTVRLKKLTNDIIERHTEEKLKQYGLKISQLTRRNALSSLILSKKSRPPVHHLLLISFLNHDPISFFGRDLGTPPFGYPPYPCLNPFCDFFKKSAIKKCHLGFSRGRNRQPLGTFICEECGFCYSKVAKNNDDTFRVGIIREYGHIWDAKLRELWQIHNGSVSAIMKKMGYGRDAILGNAKRLGLLGESAITTTNRYGDIPSIENIQRYRSKWIRIVDKNDSELDSKCLAQKDDIHLWLDRHDHAWLQANTPEKRRYRGQRNIDWKERDTCLVSTVEQAAHTLFSMNPPIRVTSNSIARQVGLTRSFKKRDLDRLPQTAKMLMRFVETPEQFALRRLDIAITLLASENTTLTASKLIKRAGISKAVQTSNVMAKVKELILAHKPP